MKTAISIPDEIFEAAERAAKRLGLSRSELYRRAVESFVAEHNDAAVTSKLNEIYGKDQGRGGLDPVLEELQASSVPPEDW